MFVDPRSSVIRQNFRILNDQLTEIRRVDPQLKILQRVQSRSKMKTADPKTRVNIFRSTIDSVDTAEWRHKSNAEILNEIL